MSSTAAPAQPAAPVTPAASANATALLVRFSANVFLACLTIGMSLSVVPLFVHDTLGYHNVIVGFAVGIQSLATVLTRKFAGRTADQRGARVALMRGLLFVGLSGIAMFATSLVALAPAPRLGALTISRLLLGVGESLCITGTLTWAIGCLGAPQSGRVMSWTGAAVFGGFAVGAPLGLALYGSTSLTGVAVLIALLPLVGRAVVARIPAVAPAHQAGGALPYSQVLRIVFLPGLALALQGVGFAVVGAFVVLYFDASRWQGAALALSAFGLAFVLLRLIGGRWPERLGNLRVAQASLGVEAIGLLLVWQAPVAWLALLGTALAGAGASLIFPSLGIEVVKRAPAASRGTSLGTYAAFQDVAILLTGPLAGAVANPFGYRAVFLCGALAAVAGVLVVLALRARRR
ncbi:arabinose transporter [Pandoraea nosoerga]|uniref:Arabinose transporter n=1 Tax=Pandoraea nosoerga TaxID=2508296 RepID=A0A5E4U3P3_9BURK|nr:arabinose transporter [Pandoraea nosoerga]MBN4666615.1 arabinose transporter [Pandoraea nosoerga]MBN4676800.1 arabinose transporter [Pandoraea nosoerga]MBN4682612.1 arabinose transporter [Pandoraea nosoerga]MBN4745790.1 arabinose transporter [Pandoraea nosoerga]VVD92749.1 arabinose transporter [Pandoraea nosoerga]